MTKLPFVVTHAGVSAQFYLHVAKDKSVRLIEQGDLREGSAAPTDDFALKLRERVDLLNDLLHSGVPFAALATCRRSPGMNGAILDPASSALENLTAALDRGGVPS